MRRAGAFRDVPALSFGGLDSDVYFSNIHAMMDFSRIEGFEWDEGNRRKSAEKHDVSQAEAEQVFFNVPLLVIADERHSAV
jgi:hypothetical protein